MNYSNQWGINNKYTSKPKKYNFNLRPYGTTFEFLDFIQVSNYSGIHERTNVDTIYVIYTNYITLYTIKKLFNIPI